jgi:hypothetical protein
VAVVVVVVVVVVVMFIYNITGANWRSHTSSWSCKYSLPIFFMFSLIMTILAS